MIEDLKIDTVLEEWKGDSVLDESRLASEIIKLPKLHAKYLEYYIHFKHKLSKMESTRNKMGWRKRQYFRGEMDFETLKKFGWSQWNGLKPSATELNQLLEFDTDMNNLNVEVADLKAAVSGCEYILNQLKGREYSLKGLIEYQRFLAGN